VTCALGQNHAEAVTAIHLNAFAPSHFAATPEPGPGEREWARRQDRWRRQEGGYSLLQATKPATLAHALADSPAGLAAWIVEKFRNWGDCNGDFESVFSRNEPLTNIMLYWLNAATGPSMRDLLRRAAQTPRGGSAGRRTCRRAHCIRRLPQGDRQRSARVGGAPLQPAALYRVPARRAFRRTGATRNAYRGPQEFLSAVPVAHTPIGGCGLLGHSRRGRGRYFRVLARREELTP
jgi:hypothetical protein